MISRNLFLLRILCEIISEYTIKLLRIALSGKNNGLVHPPETCVANGEIESRGYQRHYCGILFPSVREECNNLLCIARGNVKIRGNSKLLRFFFFFFWLDYRDLTIRSKTERKSERSILLAINRNVLLEQIAINNRRNGSNSVPMMFPVLHSRKRNIDTIQNDIHTLGFSTLYYWFSLRLNNSSRFIYDEIRRIKGTWHARL